MQASRELLSARSVSMLSSTSTTNQSVLDLTRDVPQEDILDVVKQRLKAQDEEIERDYMRSLSDSRRRAYRQLHVEIEPRRHAPRSVSAPLPRPATNVVDPYRGSHRGLRNLSSGSNRFSGSSSHLGSIIESTLSSGAPPPVRRATKPSLENITAMTPTPVALLHPSQNHSPGSNIEQPILSTSPIVLMDVYQRHNSMMPELPALAYNKPSRPTVPSPHQHEQENNPGLC
jgi:hypothetical protein